MVYRWQSWFRIRTGLFDTYRMWKMKMHSLCIYYNIQLNSFYVYWKCIVASSHWQVFYSLLRKLYINIRFHLFSASLFTLLRRSYIQNERMIVKVYNIKSEKWMNFACRWCFACEKKTLWPFGVSLIFVLVVCWSAFSHVY